MGYWEKRFHRCVLVTSPFFDHVLNDNFLEKQTGKIEISIGTPVTLEKAIMYLYGQKPKFNQENIENILHMAEFLLIPNLKSACIAWLKSDIITEENCLKYLQLSSIYEFEIPKCTNYIEEYLPEMLLNPQMLNLTKDSIQLLFSDKRLSYVTMDDKLSFLLKWSDANPDARKCPMQELVTTIDFRELSQPILEECKRTPNITDAIRLESPNLVHGNSQRALVMKGENRDGTFWCLDLERDQWFRVDSESFKEQRSYNYNEMSGTFKKDSESLICFFDKGFQQFSILALNLTLDTCSKMNIIACDESYKLKRVDDLKIATDICVIFVNEEIKSDKKIDEHSEVNEMQRRLTFMSLVGCSPIDQIVAMRLMENRSLSSFYIKTSTLYIGYIDSCNVTDVEMTPLLSFKHDEILQCCIGQNAIAIIFKSRKHVAIFDIHENSLEKIEQSTDYNDKLAMFKNGFVIYNNKRCISFTRMIGPCLEKKYDIAEILFERKNFHHIKFFLCGQMLYRYYRKSYNEHFIFESIPFQTMLSKKQGDLVPWKQLPLPKEANLCHNDTIKDTCFEISLPKSKLRCHIECPHCKKTSRTVTRRITYYDSDDYIYGDSMDMGEIMATTMIPTNQ